MKIEGNLNGSKLKFAIITARFNEFITRQLHSGAVDGLIRHDVATDSIDEVFVPGAFEIPLVAQQMAESKKYHAIITLGAVIKGSTPHFDYVCNEVAKGVAGVALKTGIPVIFGVLTTNTTEQAMERSGLKSGNKGYEAAVTAIEMANLMNKLKD